MREKALRLYRGDLSVPVPLSPCLLYSTPFPAVLTSAARKQTAHSSLVIEGRPFIKRSIYHLWKGLRKSSEGWSGTPRLIIGGQLPWPWVSKGKAALKELQRSAAEVLPDWSCGLWSKDLASPWHPSKGKLQIEIHAL